jgi:hypothetical protein
MHLSLPDQLSLGVWPNEFEYENALFSPLMAFIPPLVAFVADTFSLIMSVWLLCRWCFMFALGSWLFDAVP